MIDVDEEDAGSASLLKSLVVKEPTVDVDEEDEDGEALVGEAVEGEDELDDEDDDGEMHEEKQAPPQVPMFNYRGLDYRSLARKKPASTAASSTRKTENFKITRTRAQSGPPPDVRRARSRSASVQFSPAPETPKETLACPICAKELETDNSGLNAHIDFCLSKAAIQQAASSASLDGLRKPDKGKQAVRSVRG